MLTGIISLITLNMMACVHRPMSARINIRMMSDVKHMKEMDGIFGETYAIQEDGTKMVPDLDLSYLETLSCHICLD